MSSEITLNIFQLLSIFGLSGLVSGVISAIVTHFAAMRKSKSERHAGLINDKLIVYSVLIYGIERLLNIGPRAFPRGDDIEQRIVDIFEKIHSVLEGKIYLLEYDMVSKLMWIEDAYQPENHFPSDRWNVRFSNDDSKNVKQELINLKGQLTSKYKSIVLEHRKESGGGVPENVPASSRKFSKYFPLFHKDRDTAF